MKLFPLQFIFLFAPLIAFTQLSIEDHLMMENISNPRLFESGLIFIKRTKEAWDGRSFSSIVHMDLSSNKTIQLTQNEYDENPQWSPDGRRIAFISYRNNLQQIYIMPGEGGLPQMASDAQNYLSNYQWVDNNTIAYVDDEPRDSLFTAEAQQNGGGYWVGTEFFTNALWFYDIEKKERNKITNGDFRILEFDISADGKLLGIIGAKNYDTYEAITNSWVMVWDLVKGEIVFEFQEAESLRHIEFSPSGKQIAFVGSTLGFAADDGLFVANLQTKQTKNLSYDFDPTIQKIQWMDEENLAFLTPRESHTGLYKVDLLGNISTLISPYWVIYDFQITTEQIFFTASKGTKTNQLYQFKIGETPEQAIALTDINANLKSKIKTSSDVLKYHSYDGTKLQGILTFPPNYDASKPYPLMTIPHGGPDAVVLNDFNWKSQFFADNGYVVFQPNFRGSVGYGRPFYAGNRNAFGKTDFEDIMAGIDALIDLDIADENKLIIGGESYGGYMANWAITQTNRFKAAISIASVSNLVSLYGQHEFSNRDIGIWEYKVRPIDEVENYRRASPIFYVKNAQTPLLILHGENDTRSPTLQAWEMYRAMKDAGKTVEMMLYPRAGHGIGSPMQFKSKLNNWLNWANKYLSK